MRVISYGGGVQSTALIVLAIQGKIGQVDYALFSNVGEDSEYPETISFVREVMMPYAEQHGLPIIELTPTKHGEPTSVWKEMMRTDVNRMVIPVYGDNGPLRRICTVDFKVRPIHKWLKQNGASAENKADVMMGISTDEIQRANNKPTYDHENRCYPLLDLGLNRTDCMEVIRDAGLPVPPKSSCFFCPFHSELTWQELRRDKPELFDKAQELEDALHRKADQNGFKRVYLTRKGADRKERISEVISAAGETLFGSDIGADGCDSGFCWT